MIKRKKLRFSYKEQLYPTAPFNFEGTVHKPSHFPETDLCYENKVYWQTIRLKDEVYGMKMRDLGDIHKPIIEVTIYSDRVVDDALIKQQIIPEIEYRFDMKFDLSEFYEKCKHDKVLAPAVKRWRGMRVSVHASLYEFLVITTVLQNTTVRRSVQMSNNLFQKYGVTVEFDGKKLSGFWSPISIFKTAEEDLRGIKMGYRAKTLKRQAESFAKGELNEFHLRQLPTPELKKKLLSIYGVGPASVQYILFELFKRYGVLEYIPPFEQKIYSKLMFNKEMVEAKVILEEINKRWGRWKMLAVHYVFEDLFWQRKNRNIPWLEELIRL